MLHIGVVFPFWVLRRKKKHFLGRGSLWSRHYLTPTHSAHCSAEGATAIVSVLGRCWDPDSKTSPWRDVEPWIGIWLFHHQGAFSQTSGWIGSFTFVLGFQATGVIVDFNIYLVVVRIWSICKKVLFVHLSKSSQTRKKASSWYWDTCTTGQRIYFV